MSVENFIQSTRRTRLDNGLTLLTREDRHTGVVAIITWVKAGYFHEPDEVAGMAHLFEHMFFKGSKNFPGAEEIAQHVSSLGGITNAGTIYDSTSYYFVLPKEGFARGVEIQADAILNPLFDPEELRKECEVVIEESNRKLDNPSAVSLERMFENAFTQHRMKRWRIGSNDVLRNIRRDDLVAFFETLYRPENMIVAVTGDVTHEEALAKVRQEFGRIPAGTLRKERGPTEPPQTAFRFDEGRSDIAQSFSVMGWHTPGEGSEDEEVIDILAAILGSGKYSRLYRNVIGPGRANSVSASNSVFEDVGVFSIRTSFDDGNLPLVDAAVIREVERLRRIPPSEYEVALARNKIEAGFIFELEEVLGQAQTLAFYESRGGFENVARHLERMRSITPREVQLAAERYLRPENMTLYHYRPRTAPQSNREEALSRITAAIAEVVDANSEEIPAPEFPAPPREATAERATHRFVLSSGATLFVLESAGAPTVSVSVYFSGGRVHETKSNAGITQLTARVMRRETERRSHEQINREIEFLGSQIGITLEEDYFGFSIDVLQQHLVPAFDILADVLLSPTFPDKGIAEEKQLQLAAIKRSFDSSSERPFQLLGEALYGAHPYALPAAGFETSLDALHKEALEAWYREEVVADRAVIVIAGDVEANDVRGLCERALSGLPESRLLREPVPEFTPPDSLREIVESRDRKQTAIVVGFPAVPPQHPDWSLLRLIGNVTSGLAGTFFAELRGRRSLAYTVYAGATSQARAGSFVAYIASDAAKEEAARDGLIAEIKRLGTDGIHQEDLDRAKSYIAGTTRIRLQTNAARAADLAEGYLLGVGTDFTERFLERVRAVSLDELRGVAQRYLNHDNYAVAILRGKV